MRHGHKVLAFMLAFSMVAAACGSDDAEEAATAAPATAAPATAAPATAAPATAAPATTAAAAEAADGGCVGLVTDVGQVDDKSFNQSAWDGVQAAGSSLGVDVDYIETQAAKDYETNIGLFADSGCDVIVTVGFALGEATAIAAGEYPDVDFIGVDQFQRGWIDFSRGSGRLPGWCSGGINFHIGRDC
jgi:basic membrane protein A